MPIPLLKISKMGLGSSQTDDITLYSVVPPRLTEDIIWGIGFPPGATRVSAEDAQPLPPGLGVSHFRARFISVLDTLREQP